MPEREAAARTRVVLPHPGAPESQDSTKEHKMLCEKDPEHEASRSGSDTHASELPYSIVYLLHYWVVYLLHHLHRASTREVAVLLTT